MDNEKMANVDAAAVMHDGKWLKISDRDEVNDLKNQVSDLKKNEWKEGTITGYQYYNANNNVLIKLYDTGLAHIVGTVETQQTWNANGLNTDGIMIALDGVYFNDTETHQAVNVDNHWVTTYIHAYSGHLTVYVYIENYSSIPAGTTIPINTMEPYRLI